MTLPTKIMHSITSGNAPSSLASGQLAINEKDRKLFYLDPDAAAPKSMLDQLAALASTENLWPNAAMEIDQINAGTAVTGLGPSGPLFTYIVDNAQFFTNSAAPAARVTGQQVADAPAGYDYSVKFTVTTAEASLGATDAFGYYFTVEPKVFTKYAWGTASASSIVIGFWVKANRTGAYTVSIQNYAATRTYPVSFTIASSGVWQYVTAVIPGDTNAAWVGQNPALYIVMAAGSSEINTLNTWAGNGLSAGTGQINGVAATTDYMNVTGIMLHKGNIVVPVDRAPYMMPRYDQALQNCLRYYQKSYDIGTKPGTASNTNGCSVFQMGGMASAAYAGGASVVVTPKNAVGALTTYSPSTGTAGKARDVANAADVNTTVVNIGERGFQWQATSSAATTAPQLQAHWVYDARL